MLGHELAEGRRVVRRRRSPPCRRIAHAGRAVDDHQHLDASSLRVPASCGRDPRRRARRAKCPRSGSRPPRWPRGVPSRPRGRAAVSPSAMVWSHRLVDAGLDGGRGGGGESERREQGEEESARVGAHVCTCHRQMRASLQPAHQRLDALPNFSTADAHRGLVERLVLHPEAERVAAGPPAGRSPPRCDRTARAAPAADVAPVVGKVDPPQPRAALVVLEMRGPVDRRGGAGASPIPPQRGSRGAMMR